MLDTAPTHETCHFVVWHAASQRWRSLGTSLRQIKQKHKTSCFISKSWFIRRCYHSNEKKRKDKKEIAHTFRRTCCCLTYRILSIGRLVVFYHWAWAAQSIGNPERWRYRVSLSLWGQLFQTRWGDGWVWSYRPLACHFIPSTANLGPARYLFIFSFSFFFFFHSIALKKLNYLLIFQIDNRLVVKHPISGWCVTVHVSKGS